ncbi:hypothetical protein [Streptomyces odontomachi]|uniref:hypothetical protein n=1 Tax=Streptomyces odontomachi TaxID=2944940 RepID=UPI00210B4A8A|nr:hypothetical protein [Streptomyces sp. ODS25]
MTEPMEPTEPAGSTGSAGPTGSTGPTIAWPRALGHAQALVARPGTAAAAVAAVLVDAPCFQNRDFPLSPLPVFVRGSAAQELREPLERYGDLLGHVVRLYREHAEVRAWFALPPGAERLIAADPGPGDAPWVCRLDGYLEQGTERLVLLENNADAPAGTLFTARINDTVRRVAASLAPDAAGAAGVNGAAELSPLTYGGDDRFLSALRAAAGAAAARVPGKNAHPESVAVLQPSGAANRESREMADEFRQRGLDAFLADPRTLTVTGGRARFDGRVADLCWNKVNTVSWNAMAAEQDFVTVWERALRDTPLVHVNPFGARYVAENKLSLAFVQEPRFADLFDAAQRDLAARLLPWTRRLGTGARGPDGTTPLVDELLERQGDYVLKQPYDIRGDGVTIGDAVSRGDWRAAVRRAADEGHLAQRRVQPVRYPVVTAGSPQVEMMAISLDAYLLGGRLAGFGSKGSHHAKVNVFQGGRKLAVHVTTGEDPPATGGRDR